MSRFIDDNKPFSEEDIEYLNTRSDGPQRILVNEARFGHLEDDEKKEASDQKDADDQHDADEDAEFDEALAESEVDYDDDVIGKVEPLSYNELRQALKKAKLDTTGEKEELQDRLLEYYQEQKDNSTTTPVVDNG